MSFMVFAFLRALSVTYAASASRESYESRQGNAQEEETTETPVLREYVTSCDGADRIVRICRISRGRPAGTLTAVPLQDRPTVAPKRARYKTRRTMLCQVNAASARARKQVGSVYDSSAGTMMAETVGMAIGNR
jgi:hypothetical protein